MKKIKRAESDFLGSNTHTALTMQHCMTQAADVHNNTFRSVKLQTSQD